LCDNGLLPLDLPAGSCALCIFPTQKAFLALVQSNDMGEYSTVVINRLVTTPYQRTSYYPISTPCCCPVLSQARRFQQAGAAAAGSPAPHLLMRAAYGAESPGIRPWPDMNLIFALSTALDSALGGSPQVSFASCGWSGTRNRRMV
jgi:hypothetical protein